MIELNLVVSSPGYHSEEEYRNALNLLIDYEWEHCEAAEKETWRLKALRSLERELFSEASHE